MAASGHGRTASASKEGIVMTGSMLALTLGCCLQNPAVLGDRPQVLLNLERYRNNLRTAHIDFSTLDIIRDPRVYGPEQQRFFKHRTCRLSGRDIIWVDRGDEEGVVGRTVSGAPNPSRTNPVHVLRRGDGTWEHQEQTDRATTYDSDMPGMAPDLRALGTMYGPTVYDVADTLWRDPVPQPSPRTYEATAQDGLHIVTAKSDVGTIKWWIDPKRGWAPTRVALFRDGRVFSESRSVLKQFEGVWFPETVQYFAKGYKDGREPYKTVRVYSASWNDPEHPQHFTPEAIGIQKGMILRKKDSYGQELCSGFYNGQAFATPEEYAAQRKLASLAETVARGAELTEEEKWDLLTRDQNMFISHWEAYTAQFIQRYRLNSEQSDKGWAVLKSCQERANKYLSRHKAEFGEVQKEIGVLRDSASSEKTRRLAVSHERRRRLMQPIDDIFENQLKPRLDKLPTRAQRAAAEANAATQPAKP